MTLIAVEDKYVEALGALGNLQIAINTALQRYTIEQITNKINHLRDRAAQYRQKYALDYTAFVQRIAEDEGFVRYVEDEVSKTWEIDLADWEFCHKGIRDWTRKLEDILLT